MITKQRKTAKSLIAILVIVYLLFALFVAAFILFGLKADNNLVESLKYPFVDQVEFFKFNAKGLGEIVRVIPGALF